MALTGADWSSAENRNHLGTDELLSSSISSAVRICSQLGKKSSASSEIMDDEEMANDDGALSTLVICRRSGTILGTVRSTATVCNTSGNSTPTHRQRNKISSRKEQGTQEGVEDMLGNAWTRECGFWKVKGSQEIIEHGKGAHCIAYNMEKTIQNTVRERGQGEGGEWRVKDTQCVKKDRVKVESAKQCTKT